MGVLITTCKQCGLCCKYLTFTIPRRTLTTDETKYYDGRGVSFENIKDENGNPSRLYMREIVPCRCKYLDDNNKCTIWETRPLICDRTKRDPHQQIYKWENCTDED